MIACATPSAPRPLAPVEAADDPVDLEFTVVCGREKCSYAFYSLIGAEDKVRRRMSWDELNAHVSCFQQLLADVGVRPGDRVAAMMPNMPQKGSQKEPPVERSHDECWKKRSGGPEFSAW